MEDFYPMPAFVTLEVADVAASTAWYVEGLGFRSVFEAPGPDGRPSLVHLRRERYQDILLTPAGSDSLEHPGRGVIVNFLPGQISVADLAEKARAADSPRVEGPVERPWNVREITVHDPDGYRLRFSEPIDLDKSFEDVVGQPQEPSQ